MKKKLGDIKLIKSQGQSSDLKRKTVGLSSVLK